MGLHPRIIFEFCPITVYIFIHPNLGIFSWRMEKENISLVDKTLLPLADYYSY